MICSNFGVSFSFSGSFLKMVTVLKWLLDPEKSQNNSLGTEDLKLSSGRDQNVISLILICLIRLSGLNFWLNLFLLVMKGYLARKGAD